MTNQEKKRWLLQYRSCGAEIERLEAEIARWLSQAERMTSRYGLAAGGSSDGDPLQAAVEKIVQLTTEQGKEVERRIRLRREIEEAIAAVSDERLRLILHYRYIDGHTLYWVSETLYMDYRWIKKLHGKALESLCAPACA